MNPPEINDNDGKQLKVGKLLSMLPPKIIEKEMSQFATALAHEVRNPLTNINLAVDMLKSSIRDNDQKIYLDIIIRGTRRINDLVTDLLTSNQAGELPLEEHSIHKLLDEVLEATQDRITLKNITVNKAYMNSDCIILLNELKIKVALTNIIVNAIDAMHDKNGQLNILTKLMNKKCIIEIEDNGVGISEENLNNIFKPYFTNKPGGMGLGLSTTFNILISNHAGIAVRSNEGKGTCFILSFDAIENSCE